MYGKKKMNGKGEGRSAVTILSKEIQRLQIRVDELEKLGRRLERYVGNPDLMPQEFKDRILKSAFYKGRF